MKIPKTTNRYCPFCHRHTEHKVSQVRAKGRPKTKKGGFKWGVRHMADILSGYGGFPRPIVHEKSKTSTRATFKYECSVCGKKHIKSRKRAKRVSLV